MKLKRKVWIAKKQGQKMITIPKCSDIEAGDWVWIEKIENENLYPQM